TAPSGEERSGRQLHFIADDDDLMRTVNGRYCFFQWNLARFVEDNNIEQIRIQRQSIGNAEWAHEPDWFQILNHSPRLTRCEMTNGLIPHRFAELVFEVAPSACIGFLEYLLFRTELRCR